MKITRSYLKQVIKEELNRLSEGNQGSDYTLTQDIKLSDKEMGPDKGIFNLQKGYYQADIDGSNPEMVLIFTQEGNPVGNAVKRDWFRMAVQKGIFVSGRQTLDRSYSARPSAV